MEIGTMNLTMKSDPGNVRRAGRWTVAKGYRGVWTVVGRYATEAEARKVALETYSVLFAPLS